MTDRSISESTTELTGATARDASEYDFVNDNLISNVHLTGRVTERENGSGVRAEEARISNAYDVPSDNDVTMAPNTREEEESVTHGTVRILALRKQQKVRETAAEALGHSYNNVRLAPKPPEKVTTVKSAKSDDPVTGQMRAPIFDI